VSANAELVHEMLKRDLHAAERLKALLSQERTLLQERNHEALSTVITEKNAHLTLLAGHAKERAALLEAIKLKDDPDSWQAFLNTDPALRSLIPLWQELRDNIKQCNELNNHNGKLVARSQQTLKKLIDLMRGKTPTAGLYDAQGSATYSAPSNTLTQA
jgi:flagella synthesis protein FlgN